MQKVVSGIVGVEKFYFAPIKSDIPNQTPDFEKPQYFEGIKELGLKITINTEKLYAENKLWESDTAFDSTEATINIVDLLTQQESLILGHEISTEGGLIYKDSDKATPGAILIKANKANGKARYIILYNNTFADSDESYKGKEGKTDFQTKSIVATGAPLKSNGMWKYKIDEEDGMTDEKFFNSVIIPKSINEVNKVEVEYSGYTSGEVTDISVINISFNKSTHKFVNVPETITTFTFKLNDTTVTATKSEGSWSFE